MNKLTGCVKWFDSRLGYGFVTCLDSGHELHNTDIFLHFSSISVSDEYKKVFPGEYISFDIDTNKNGKVITKDVRGVLGGPLLIENNDYNYRVIRKSHE